MGRSCLYINFEKGEGAIGGGEAGLSRAFCGKFDWSIRPGWGECVVVVVVVVVYSP